MYIFVNSKPFKCLTRSKYCKYNADQDKILLALSDVITAFKNFFWAASTRYNHLQLESVNIVIILASINFQLDVVWSHGVIFQLSIVWFSRAGTSTTNFTWILWAEKSKNALDWIYWRSIKWHLSCISQEKMFMIRSLVVLTFALLAQNVKEYISYIAKYSYLYHIVHVYNMKYGFEICLDNFRERFCCAFVVWMKGPPHRPDDRAPEECRWLALKRKKKSGLIMRRGQLGPGPTKGMSFWWNGSNRWFY